MTPGAADTFTYEVRRSIYNHIFTLGHIPSVGETAAALGRPAADIQAAHARLAASHVIVLQPDSDEILMANPFSAVPTAFQVEAGGRAFWGNCIWDALGIALMLNEDARVVAACGDCGSSMVVVVKDGALVDPPGVAHFSVPARHWWDNITFT